MTADLKCRECGAGLPPRSGRGRPRIYCADCIRRHKNAADRERYATDPAYREAQLKRRHERYAANREREQERARRWYAENRENRIAKRS